MSPLGVTSLAPPGMDFVLAVHALTAHLVCHILKHLLTERTKYAHVTSSSTMLCFDGIYKDEHDKNTLYNDLKCCKKKSRCKILVLSYRV